MTFVKPYKVLVRKLSLQIKSLLFCLTMKLPKVQDLYFRMKMNFLTINLSMQSSKKKLESLGYKVELGYYGSVADFYITKYKTEYLSKSFMERFLYNISHVA